MNDILEKTFEMPLMLRERKTGRVLAIVGGIVLAVGIILLAYGLSNTIRTLPNEDYRSEEFSVGDSSMVSIHASGKTSIIIALSVYYGEVSYELSCSGVVMTSGTATKDSGFVKIISQPGADTYTLKISYYAGDLTHGLKAYYGAQISETPFESIQHISTAITGGVITVIAALVMLAGIIAGIVNTTHQNKLRKLWIKEKAK
ncbi:MAG: hypothetical protein CVT48_03035 [Thermoplasmata archaeon HGW-Thermoplasmata-1]|nr:MAG: hypothetical protein CVT48_03035 [Thermoplasmata archaeon HGW-Thermoplasmata-1]